MIRKDQGIKTLNSPPLYTDWNVAKKSTVVFTKPNRGRAVRLATHSIAEGRSAKPTPGGWGRFNS